MAQSDAAARSAELDRELAQAARQLGNGSVETQPSLARNPQSRTGVVGTEEAEGEVVEVMTIGDVFGEDIKREGVVREERAVAEDFGEELLVPGLLDAGLREGAEDGVLREGAEQGELFGGMGLASGAASAERVEGAEVDVGAERREGGRGARRHSGSSGGIGGPAGLAGGDGPERGENMVGVLARLLLAFEVAGEARGFFAGGELADCSADCV